MPSALAMTRSSGVVMKPRTRPALAPTYAVLTWTTATSVRGYCLTDKARTACRPAIRITTLTTIASTGRRTKRSVSFTSPLLRARRRLVGGLHLVVHLHRRPAAELEHPGGHHLLTRFQA